MSKKKFRWDFWNVVTIVIMLLFIVCMIYPLLNLFLSGFQETVKTDGGETAIWTLANYAEFFLNYLSQSSVRQNDAPRVLIFKISLYRIDSLNNSLQSSPCMTFSEKSLN